MSLAKTVLTVDDSPTIRELLRAALLDLGYRVVQAVDGAAGVEALEGERPDVIITDINMPRMDGFGFIECVRSDARHRATSILALTTESDPEMKERARRAGATGWIVKPFEPRKLAEAIRRVTA